MNYVVISKDIHRNEGKHVLMSFAQAPLWKTFRYVNWQNDTIPNCYTKKEATYALNKYASDELYEIRTYDSVQKEFTEYKTKST